MRHSGEPGKGRSDSGKPTNQAHDDVVDGDAKIWGTAEDVLDDALHQRYAEALFKETGFDLRDRTFEHFFKAHVVGAAAVEINDNHLDITTWQDGSNERVHRKH